MPGQEQRNLTNDDLCLFYDLTNTAFLGNYTRRQLQDLDLLKAYKFQADQAAAQLTGKGRDYKKVYLRLQKVRNKYSRDISSISPQELAEQIAFLVGLLPEELKNRIRKFLIGN